MKRKKFDKILNDCRFELDILENNTHSSSKDNTISFPNIFLTKESHNSIKRLYQKIEKLRRYCENEQNRIDNLIRERCENCEDGGIIDYPTIIFP